MMEITGSEPHKTLCGVGDRLNLILLQICVFSLEA